MSRHPQVHEGRSWRLACTVYGPEVGHLGPSFDSEDEMWAVMLDDELGGWTRRDDGRVLCRQHSKVAECDECGHHMLGWREHPLDDELAWRYCINCGAEFEQRILTN